MVFRPRLLHYLRCCLLLSLNHHVVHGVLLMLLLKLLLFKHVCLCAAQNDISLRRLHTRPSNLVQNHTSLRVEWRHGLCASYLSVRAFIQASLIHDLSMVWLLLHLVQMILAKLPFCSDRRVHNGGFVRVWIHMLEAGLAMMISFVAHQTRLLLLLLLLLTVLVLQDRCKGSLLRGLQTAVVNEFCLHLLLL